MNELNLPTWSMVTTVILLGAATYTDLRWRRIPNYLTFPAIAAGLALNAAFNGWEGLLLSLSGLILAPSLLSLFHGGKGLGMGDIKLAAALGALLGPALGVLAMVLSMVVGGFLAIAYLMKEWGVFGGRWTSGADGLPSGNKGSTVDSEPEAAPSPVGGLTIPYGLAFTFGTLLTLVVCLWTGKENWYFWSEMIAAMP